MSRRNQAVGRHCEVHEIFRRNAPPTGPGDDSIGVEWIQYVVDHPAKEVVQKDGRIRRWAPIEEMENRYLRVILLEDGETVHNAFFDRRFAQ